MEPAGDARRARRCRPLFRADEEGPGRNGVVILSEALWKRSFGGDPRIVGRRSPSPESRTSSSAWLPTERVGVLPDRWHVAAGKEAEFWIPLDFDVKNEPRDLHMMTVVGRLKPELTFAQASQRISSMAAGLREKE